jgi:nicotinamide riboside transporter PnuC
MHFVDVFGWAATAIALMGVWMNNRRWRACFVLWLISNAITFGIHTAAGMWPMAARDGAFFVMAIHGWWMWRAGVKKAVTGSTSCQQDVR